MQLTLKKLLKVFICFPITGSCQHKKELKCHLKKPEKG